MKFPCDQKKEFSQKFTSKSVGRVLFDVETFSVFSCEFLLQPESHSQGEAAKTNCVMASCVA